MKPTWLKSNINMNTENTFTTFTSLSVIQVWREKFTTFIFILMMKEEANFCQDWALREFMVKTFWSTDKNTITSLTDYLRKLMNLHNWKSSSAQCSMADKQFIESLTLNWSFDCLSDFVFSWLLGSFLFILINNLFENKDKSMRDVLHVNILWI